MKNLLLLLLLPLSCFAQALDPTFNGAHNGPYDENMGLFGQWTDTGKLMTYSSGFFLGGTNPIKRYNNDGSPDTSFPTIYDNYISFFFKGSNGKFGGFEFGGSSYALYFFNQDGSAISGFTQPVLSDNSYLWNVLWQEDGKVIIVGDFTTVNGLDYKGIARLNADGSVDTTFATGTGANGMVYCVARQPDGKYIIGGEFTAFNGNTRRHLTRLNSNGSLDSTFYAYSTTTYYPYYGVRNVEVQADGKLFISGCGFLNGTAIVTKSVARLLADGTRDTSFNCAIGSLNPMQEFLILPSGKYLIYAGDEHILYRINSNGTFDNTFTYNNTTIALDMHSLQNVADNKIFLNCTYTSPTGITRLNMHRINADGTIDLTFNPQESFNSTCDALKVLQNNKIVATGSFGTYNDTACGPNLCRLTENGELDPAFVKDSQLTIGGVLIIKEQVDHKLVLGASGTGAIYLNSVAKPLVRVLENGTLDTTFTVASTVTGVNDFEVLNDGKILAVAGYAGGNKLIRLNPDGSVDTTFTPVTQLDSTTHLTMFADGSLFRIAEASNAGDVERVYKLNPDGTPDTSWNCPLYRVLEIDRQADGQYLVSYYSGSSRKVARVTNTGAVDTSFTTITKSNSVFGYDPLFVNSENKIFIFRVGNYQFTGVDIFNASGVFEQNVSGSYANMIVKQGCDNVLMGTSDIRRYKIFTGTITPTPTGASPQAFVANYTLANLLVSGANISWYAAQSQCGLNTVQKSNETSLTADTPLPLTTPLVNGTTYYASQTINGIESTYRLPVLVTSTLGVPNFDNQSFTINNPVLETVALHSDYAFNKVELYGINGARVLERTFTTTTDANLNLDKLAKGFYIVKLYTEKGVFSKKLLKE